MQIYFDLFYGSLQIQKFCILYLKREDHQKSQNISTFHLFKIFLGDFYSILSYFYICPFYILANCVSLFLYTPFFCAFLIFSTHHSLLDCTLSIIKLLFYCSYFFKKFLITYGFHFLINKLLPKLIYSFFKKIVLKFHKFH